MSKIDVQKFVDTGILDHYPRLYTEVVINDKIVGRDDPANLILILDKAIRNAMVGSHIGMCLSGGLDSTTLVRLASRYGQVETITTLFPGTDVDESKYVNMAIDWRVDPNIVTPEAPTEREILEMIRIHKGPIASLSIYIQWCVMRTASLAGIKILIDGQGPDELLCGYIGYQKAYIRELFARRYYRLAVRELTFSLWHHWRVLLKALRTKGSTDQFKGSLDELIYRDLTTTSVPAELATLEANAKEFNIEVRSPYLGYEVVDYLASLAHNQRIRDGTSKWILREATNGILPDGIRYRQGKLGFPAPEELWMRRELKPLVLEIIYSRSFSSRPFWNAREIQILYQKYLAGKVLYDRRLWRVVCTELWLRISDEPTKVDSSTSHNTDKCQDDAHSQPD